MVFCSASGTIWKRRALLATLTRPTSPVCGWRSTTGRPSGPSSCTTTSGPEYFTVRPLVLSLPGSPKSCWPSPMAASPPMVPAMSWPGTASCTMPACSEMTPATEEVAWKVDSLP